MKLTLSRGATIVLLSAGLPLQVLATSQNSLAPHPSMPRPQHHEISLIVQIKVMPPKRLALVIGNGAYEGDRLANPTNDAEDIARGC